jgi:hypothetical protein
MSQIRNIVKKFCLGFKTRNSIKALSKCNADPYFCIEFRKTGLEDFKFGPESHEEKHMLALVGNAAEPWQVLSHLDLTL